LTYHHYHIYTDLDFWDTRRLLKGFAEARRNFGKYVDGDEFPSQVIYDEMKHSSIREIEKRLRRAIPSPPRHLIVRSMVMEGFFEFEPRKYYPDHWSRTRMTHFTYQRLPLEQAALSSPYQMIRLFWVGEKLRVERVQRESRYDPVIRTRAQARKRLHVPSCF
jgi:hypothetical protein